MKVRIDQGKCRSHFVCNLIAPNIFSVDDGSDFPTPIDCELNEEQLESAERAGLSCPERAIIIE